MTGARVVMEVGPRSPWLSRMLSELGHDVIVATPGRVRLIARSQRKTGRSDAEHLARLGRFDPALLFPIRHRSAMAQADLRLRRGHRLLARYGAHHDSRAGSTPRAIGGDRLLRAPGRGGASGAGPVPARTAVVPAVRRRFGGAPPGPARAPGARRGESPAQTCPGSCGPACAGTQRRRFTTQLVAIDVEGDRMRRRDYGSGGLRKRGNSWQATLWLPRDPDTQRRTRTTSPQPPGRRHWNGEADTSVGSSMASMWWVPGHRSASTLDAGSVNTRRDRFQHGPSRATSRRDVSSSPRSARCGSRTSARHTSRRPSLHTCGRGQAIARPRHTWPYPEPRVPGLSCRS